MGGAGFLVGFKVKGLSTVDGLQKILFRDQVTLFHDQGKLFRIEWDVSWVRKRSNS